MGAWRIWRWALVVAACAVPVTGAAAVAAEPVVPVVASSGPATVPSTDLRVAAGSADGTVGTKVSVQLRLRNLGPDDAPAGAVVLEYVAPAGASLIGTYAPGGIATVPFGTNPNCTWVTKPTDVRCVHVAKLPVHSGPGSTTDEQTYLVMRIDARITAPGSYHAGCKYALCKDPKPGDNTAAIVIDSPSPSPSVTPTPTPTPTVTATATVTPSHSPTATHRSASASATPSVSPTPADTGSGADPTDDSGAPAAAVPPDRGDGGGLDITAIVWTVLGAALVLAAGIALLLVRRREPVLDLDEDTDDLTGLLGS